MTCDCERGGPCSKVTVCRMESAVEEAREEAADEIERLRSERDHYRDSYHAYHAKLAEARSRLKKLADALESGSVKAAVWRVIEIIDGREEWDPKVHGTGPLTGNY